MLDEKPIKLTDINNSSKEKKIVVRVVFKIRMVIVAVIVKDIVGVIIVIIGVLMRRLSAKRFLRVVLMRRQQQINF